MPDCTQGNIYAGEIEAIISESLILMSEFSYASVSFIYRDQNSEAHNLIGLELSCGSRTWFGDLF